MKCKKGTRETVRRKIRALGKDEPLIGKLEMEHDGRINLTQLYQALTPMSREERIRCTISAFSTVLESTYPIIQRDLGPDRTRDIVTGAYSYFLTEYPALYSMMVKSRPRGLP
jgi:hypothetical protein